ncbi:hypothetical protein HKD37_01G001626 [Glycine soja]
MAKFPTSSTISILSQYQSFSLPTILPTNNTQSSTKATPKSTTKPPNAHLRPNTTLNRNPKHQPRKEFSKKKKPVEFTPILVSYANLLPYLLNNAMVVIIPAKIPQPPFSRVYNSNATCAYHGGVSGHSIEHCMTLKHKVQSLIDAGWLKFEEDNCL